MVAEVEQFKPADELNKQSVVKTLEELTKSAVAGEISAIVIGIVRPDGALNTEWSESNRSAAQMLGASSLLLYRLNKYLDDGCS